MISNKAMWYRSCPWQIERFEIADDCCISSRSLCYNYKIKTTRYTKINTSTRHTHTHKLTQYRIVYTYSYREDLCAKVSHFRFSCGTTLVHLEPQSDRPDPSSIVCSPDTHCPLFLSPFFCSFPLITCLSCSLLCVDPSEVRSWFGLPAVFFLQSVHSVMPNWAQASPDPVAIMLTYWSPLVHLLDSYVSGSPCSS